MTDRDVEGVHSEQELWHDYIILNNHAARDQLIQFHMPLAKSIASKIYNLRQDENVAFEDYLQYAHVGLIEAIERYSLDKNALFSTYATFRIKGSIYNGIQKFTEKKEQIALKSRLRKERQDSLLEVDNQNLTTFELLVESTIGLALVFMLEDTSFIKCESDVCDNGPYSNYKRSEIYAYLKKVVSSLNDKERQIIELHYFDYKNFNEIANELGLSKGRISQIHKLAISRIRDMFGNINSIDTEF